MKASLTPVREGRQTPSPKHSFVLVPQPTHGFLSGTTITRSLPSQCSYLNIFSSCTSSQASQQTKGYLPGLSPAWCSTIQSREWGFCTLLGTKWLGLSSGEHHRHLAASLDSLIKAFVESHRRAKRKPSKFCPASLFCPKRPHQHILREQGICTFPPWTLSWPCCSLQSLLCSTTILKQRNTSFLLQIQRPAVSI